MLQSSPCQQSLHSPAHSVVASPGRHRGRDFAGHEEQAPALGSKSAIEAYALGNPERAPIPEVRFAFHCERLEVRCLVNHHRAGLDLIWHQLSRLPWGRCCSRKRVASSSASTASRTDSAKRGFAISLAMSARVARANPSFFAIFCVIPASWHAWRNKNGQFRTVFSGARPIEKLPFALAFSCWRKA